MLTTTALYYIFHGLGFLAMLVYVLIMYKHYGFSKWKAIVFYVVSFACMYAWTLILKRLITGTGGQNAIRSYIFLPAFVCLFAYALGLDINKALDFSAVAPCIVQGIGHIGCIFPGCCYSWLEAGWGIYSQAAGKTLFPVQLCESVSALLIGLWVILYNRKQGYNGRALSMPKMMVAFGLVRFGWEFLRDNQKIFWGISELALWALGMSLVGGIWLIFLNNGKQWTKKKNRY